MTRNILIFNWQDIRNPLGGGAEVHLHEIFKRIAAKGYQITLVSCSHPQLPDQEIVDGIKIIRHGHRNVFNFHVPKLYKKLTEESKFDVVIDDINKIPFYTPLFVKEPIIGIIHHLFGRSIFLEAPLPIALYVIFAESLIPKIYNKIPMAVVSNSTRDELIEKGLKPENISLVQNAVDSSDYAFDAKLKSPIPMIGYLGRIKKYKSVHHLIQALKIVVDKIPEARLLLVGDGDYLSEIKKLVNKLNLNDYVIFTGSTHEKEKVDYLNQMWFMVNPSPKEGWGLTVIEANSCGLPVIAADSPGLRDSVVHGKTGYLYPYGEIEKLAELIIKLLKDEKLRQSFAPACIDWAKKFNWNNSAEKMMQLIEEVITRREFHANR